jgi:transcriptional regulator with PAS, ATPase and Fis domain
LHRHSLRKDEAFISVDLGSLTESLFESELFGHMKGAFTDAKTDRPGRFELAAGGTIFLDEIGNLTLPLQAKILTVLERREVTRVGANKPKPIDIRLISATNMGIKQMAAEGAFRQDLLYRINTVEIEIPPLRDRTDDIPLLADHFLSIFSKKYNKKISRLSSPIIKKLSTYSWPGNVREFQHVMERALIMSDSSTLSEHDFHLSGHSSGSGELEIDSYNLDDVERKIIDKVLKKYQGNVSKAASDLGLTRTSLYRRLEKHGL